MIKFKINSEVLVLDSTLVTDNGFFFYYIESNDCSHLYGSTQFFNKQYNGHHNSYRFGIKLDYEHYMLLSTTYDDI